MSLILMQIQISPSAITIAKGNTISYKAYGTYDDKSILDITTTVTWNSSAPQYATIDSNGLVTAIDDTGGFAKSIITASLDGIISNESPVTVDVKTISYWQTVPALPVLTIGRAIQLYLKKTYSDGTTQNVMPISCISSDISIATSTTTGIIRAISTGVSILDIIVLDDNNNQVVLKSFVLVQTKPSYIPVGGTMDYQGETDPDGWLIENGRELSKTQYQDLYNLYSTDAGTPRYGSCASSAEFYGVNPETPSNIIRIRNLGTGTTPHDILVGLSGFTVSTIPSSDPQNTIIACLAANNFDPSSGYIRHYGRSFNKVYLDWYIIFIKDGIENIHPDVPITSSNRIIYVHINSGDTSIQVGTALMNACNYIGFYLNDPRGYTKRIWNNSTGIDPNASTRFGRVDGYNGDHVGTYQLDSFKYHTHDMITLGLWNTGSGSGTGAQAFKLFTTSSQGMSVSTNNYAYSVINNTGGLETICKNVSYSSIVKY